MAFKSGDIVRALVSTDPEDPIAIRKGHLYEICTTTRHKNSGVIYVMDAEAGNLIRQYSETLFEPFLGQVIEPDKHDTLTPLPME